MIILQILTTSLDMHFLKDCFEWLALVTSWCTYGYVIWCTWGRGRGYTVIQEGLTVADPHLQCHHSLRPVSQLLGQWALPRICPQSKRSPGNGKLGQNWTTKMSVQPNTHRSIYDIHPFIISIHPSVRLSIHSSFCPSACPSIHPFTDPSIHPSV